MSKQILYLGLDPTHHPEKVVHWPIIQIVPRPLSEIQQVLSNFPQYSHVIITSKSTVAILNDYLPRLGIDIQIWRQKTTLAVGQVTAKHLEVCGIKPAKIAHEETAEGIIYELSQMSLEDAHVFWPHSAQARSVIKDFLVDQGIRHTTCPLYDTQPQIPEKLPSLDDFDEIVFTSPSTVKAFLQIFGTFPPNIQLVTIGPITARFLEAQQKSLALPKST